MEFDLLNFTKNAVERLLSFGQLPENVPEINMEGYSYNTVEAFLDISISSNKSSILISKCIKLLLEVNIYVLFLIFVLH